MNNTDKIIKNNTNFKLVYLLSSIIFVGSCKNKEIKDQRAATLGRAEIWADESLRKIVNQEEEVFELAYKNADIKINFISETEAMRKFYQDSADVVIVSHAIDSTELKKFNSKKLFPRQYHFATSSIAFIANKNSDKTQYTYAEIIELLTSNDSESKIFVVEGEGSGLANELLKHTKTERLGKNVYAKKTKAEVIDWVINNPNAIGIIDWSDISDAEEKEASQIKDKIKVLSISTKTTKGEYVDASQYNLNGLYPFTRDLYIIRKFGYNDVSLGFASFVCSERGQKIVLKSGILPKYQSERWVEFGTLKDIDVVE